MFFKKASTKVQPEDLSMLIPLRNLPKRILHYVASMATLEQSSKNTKLFDINEKTKDVLYLIKGEVTLFSADGSSDTITANSLQAHFPLNHKQPCTLYDLFQVINDLN